MINAGKVAPGIRGVAYPHFLRNGIEITYTLFAERTVKHGSFGKGNDKGRLADEQVLRTS